MSLPQPADAAHLQLHITCCTVSRTTFLSCLPPGCTQTLGPTVSCEKCKGLQTALCTAIRGRFLGHFCLFVLWLLHVGLGRLLLGTIKPACFPLNFSSNFRTSRTGIFWRDYSVEGERGGGWLSWHHQLRHPWQVQLPSLSLEGRVHLLLQEHLGRST